MRALLYILVLMTMNSFAGKPETYVIPISGDGYSATVEAYQSEVNIKVDNELTYYWVKSKTIHSSVGGYSGLLLHGQFKSSYSDGQIKEQGQYRNGLKHGVWKQWYTNGELKEVLTYRSGKLNGKALKYDPEGRLLLSGKYKKGKRHGEYLIYEEGKISSKKTYKKGVEEDQAAEKPEKIKKTKEPKPKKEKKVRPKKDKGTDKKTKNKEASSEEKKS